MKLLSNDSDPLLVEAVWSAMVYAKDFLSGLDEVPNKDRRVTAEKRDASGTDNKTEPVRLAIDGISKRVQDGESGRTPAQNTFPVPVLAEPPPNQTLISSASGGEARESNTASDADAADRSSQEAKVTDSRGGENTLTAAPVLAEPTTESSLSVGRSVSGEARESMSDKPDIECRDSRGGSQTFLGERL